MPAEKFKNKYRISTARAPWHNYNGGWYFVTICTACREHFFGEIVRTHGGENHIQLSETGRYAGECIREIHSHNPYAVIPLYVVMPNHVHLIVAIDGKMQHGRGIHTVRRRTCCGSAQHRDGANPSGTMVRLCGG